MKSTSLSYKRHLVWTDRKHKSFVAWFGVAVVVLRPGVFLHSVQVERIVKAVVFVGDDVEDDVTVVLKCVHVMVDDHRSGVVLCVHHLAGLSVYQVDQSLLKKSRHSNVNPGVTASRLCILKQKR